MANNPASDSLGFSDTPGVTGPDWDSMVFDDIDEGDLFWFTNIHSSNENHAYRKLSDSTAQNTRNRSVIDNINRNKAVYQKI